MGEIMITKHIIKDIFVDKEGLAQAIRTEVNGKIIKVVLDFNREASPEIEVLIKTSDNEDILNIQGNEVKVFYPVHTISPEQTGQTDPRPVENELRYFYNLGNIYIYIKDINTKERYVLNSIYIYTSG